MIGSSEFESDRPGRARNGHPVKSVARRVFGRRTAQRANERRANEVFAAVGFCQGRGSMEFAGGSGADHRPQAKSRVFWGGALLAGAAFFVALAVAAPSEAFAGCGSGGASTGAHSASSGGGGTHSGASVRAGSSGGGASWCGGALSTGGALTPSLAGVHTASSRATERGKRALLGAPQAS